VNHAKGRRWASLLVARLGTLR